MSDKLGKGGANKVSPDKAYEESLRKGAFPNREAEGPQAKEAGPGKVQQARRAHDHQQESGNNNPFGQRQGNVPHHDPNEAYEETLG